ncbi:MAG: cell division protein FtsZ [Candidatus Staskawiczbacteria bacterium RIFOXYD2_FULL_37_9]|uniref:Cell division protein FtsZ n=1 Tax=Candidatus Staskawiczbacteria bacterium RIFOXYB1_FULL_37_44 TaxID=1802223 RepID=A0A1G2IXX1_9BACT|nr:MAG: cell division protein FtsZ [Candidatus Staskawiczbacteria bacterium RIFOXYB1_FULL_37_44]OGZ83523.1 MAG: cell division protein FtsZ [Candidatus Staskawiczbacteria bacterium RIFOXYC1_FULL_37_52]OGZ88671.1 MAG: cell division protein FtsZ [Candidatus Staskawiczbacteria bacterium RIFOXYC2_FULL_37_19]OGZ89473.1 MAG: cell division protein FtsZ [Candidatus Staskawiczbacteria bacterium RIFOXYD1_FULL_37_110]OGZ93920.1 MAG: cell division protein FtsZ [Candidatus Staskawiczbacteria bacterium RIFOXY
MSPQIKVVGVGGSGSNTVSRMVKFEIKGVELIAVNTDAQALHFSTANQKILIGKEVTKGLGTGMDLNLGKLAAEESKEELLKAVTGADMVFVTCGLGGGTGSGAAPVIAEIAKNLGILTVAVVTTPFSFEGSERKKIAERALENFQGKTDSLLVISNDKLLKIVDEKTTVASAFFMCDEVLKEAVQGITDLILTPGIINIDFASVLSIMKNSGHALFGAGRAAGENRAVLAAEKAINSPLLDFSIKGSKGVLFNASGQDITLNEIQEAAKIITKNVDPRAQIIFGAIKDNTLKKGEIKISVIATKF